MSLPLFTIVFPDGRTEYRTAARAPVAGDVIHHLGHAFVVDTVGNDHAGTPIVTLRRHDPSPPTDET